MRTFILAPYIFSSKWLCDAVVFATEVLCSPAENTPAPKPGEYLSFFATPHAVLEHLPFWALHTPELMKPSGEGTKYF